MLREAVYVKLALAAYHGIGDEGFVLDFSETAYQQLKRWGIPFPGALRVAGTALPRPRPDDPLYLRLREFSKDALQRRFNAISLRIKRRLYQLRSLQDDFAAITKTDATAVPPVAFMCFAALTSSQTSTSKGQ
ncbi:MAG: hypothetical protein KatS3mg107_0854 [Gemmataceae bacterium]|nr:MAG: hypothetical protein KatS3mg107_0854 [Gemmataceae bacterium]